jgi:hypothetical protein
MSELRLRFHHQIADIPAQAWDRLANTPAGSTPYPFIRHAFLHALEASASVCPETGWQPHHLSLSKADTDELVAVLPLYLKTHSYGEYVFDWSWADAYRQHGLNYYPKLLSAIPFTPATGPRLLHSAQFDLNTLTSVITQALQQFCQQAPASSLHILFPDTDTLTEWPETLQRRRGVQYHWFNDNYANFDDFLQGFSSRKRKNLKKERRSVSDQGITLVRKEGETLSAADWQHFYHCYQSTYQKRSGHSGYLKQAFFKYIADTLPEQIMMVIAYKDQQAIAAALTFRDEQTLYGRYWGCLENYSALHFEACYYQGIEYCIEKGLKRFDPGAQGEHKIQRGFKPVSTHSIHWLAHPGFAQAIESFLTTENNQLDEYLLQASQLLPFKHSDSA